MCTAACTLWYVLKSATEGNTESSLLVTCSWKMAPTEDLLLCARVAHWEPNEQNRLNRSRQRQQTICNIDRLACRDSVAHTAVPVHLVPHYHHRCHHNHNPLRIGGKKEASPSNFYRPSSFLRHRIRFYFHILLIQFPQAIILKTNICAPHILKSEGGKLTTNAHTDFLNYMQCARGNVLYAILWLWLVWIAPSLATLHVHHKMVEKSENILLRV